jgi:hypothetical protein
MRAATAGSTARIESAKIALPVAEVLRRSSPPSGKHTPWSASARGSAIDAGYSDPRARSFRQDDPDKDKDAAEQL